MSSPGKPPSPSNPQVRRLQQGVRDMLLSLLVLLVIIGALAWLGRGCSFAPGGVSADTGGVPKRDAGQILRNAAHRVPFPVRAPTVPAGWRANSGDIAGVGAGGAGTTLVRVGWVTAPGGFLGLAQSDAAAAALAAEETGVAQVSVQGSVTVDGRKWTVYPGRRAERCWVTDLGGVRVLVTGSAGESDFRTLATAVAAARPVPR